MLDKSQIGLSPSSSGASDSSNQGADDSSSGGKRSGRESPLIAGVKALRNQTKGFITKRLPIVRSKRNKKNKMDNKNVARSPKTPDQPAGNKMATVLKQPPSNARMISKAGQSDPATVSLNPSDDTGSGGGTPKPPTPPKPRTVGSGTDEDDSGGKPPAIALGSDATNFPFPQVGLYGKKRTRTEME